MAGNAIIGALRVVLGMDTGQFEDGAKRATSSLEKFGSNMGKIGATIGVAVTAAAVGLGHAIKGVIDEADKLGKAAQKFGVPVEQLGALTYAAELSDVSLETLGKSLTILSKNMQAVAGGATNIAAAAFNNLHISVKNADGTLKSSNELFLDVAARFKDMQDGATKTALAVAIFGRAGAELIPLLNQGRDGIKSLTDEFRDMGLVIDEKTAKAAENFNDNLKRLGKVQQAVIIQVLGSGGLMDALERLSFRMVEAAGNAERWKRVSDGLGTTLEGVATWVLVVAKAVDTLTLPIQAIIGAIVKLSRGDFAGAWDEITSALGRAIPNLKEIFGLVTKGQEDVSLWVDILKTVGDSLSILENIKFAPKPFSEKQFELGKKFNDTLEKMALETRALNGEFDKLAPGFVQAAEKWKDLDGFGTKFGTTLDSLNPKQRALNDALAAFGRAQVTQEMLLPWQIFDEQMAKLNAKFPEGQRSLEAYGLKSQQIALTLAQSWGQTAQSIVSPMADAFKTLATLNKKYATAAKAAAIGEAVVNTYLAATKALASVPPPFNYAAAIAVTAAGLANVAKISATEFQTGGSFKVGGVGGPDSQLVSFAATPGEMVDVRRPDSSGGSTTTVQLSGIRPNDFFRGDMLRELVNSLNAAHSDGYKLKFAS